MAIPTLMIPASALLSARLSRILNLAASVAYLLVNFGNLLGETWAYYWLFGLLEISAVIAIFSSPSAGPRRGPDPAPPSSNLTG
jgi:hypothetical protein